MTRVRRVAAVVLTLAATVLATTARTDADAATTIDRSAIATPATTDLHLHVTGCDSCRITLQHAVTGLKRVWSSAAKVVGPDHRVSWRVPTSRTSGMSFTLEAPWAGARAPYPTS
jgi:hypothetical protein